MKKTCVIIAVFTVLIIGLVGCNKENSKNETPAIVDVTENVTGTFEGYTLAQSDYFSDLLTEEETLAITRNDVNVVDVTLESNSWGTITITGVTVSGSSAPYTFSGSGKCAMSMGPQVNEYDCALSATIYGTDSDVFTFDIPAVMGGTKVVFHKGEAPVE